MENQLILLTNLITKPMQQIEHFIFILFMFFLGAGVIVGGYKHLKRRIFYLGGTKINYAELSRKQKQLNKTFEKILDEYDKDQHKHKHKHKHKHRTANPNDTSKPSHMAQMKAKYAKAYQPWTKEEDEELRLMVSYGESMQAMTQNFQRGRGAIRSRIKKLSC